MSEIMDTSNKSEDTRDATDIIDPASDQEKTVEVSILERVFLHSPLQEGINFFDNLTYICNKQA